MNILYFIPENETFMIQIQDGYCQPENNYTTNDFTNSDKKKKNKKEKNDFMFSHWVLYPTWLLCIFVMLGCAFLVIWYGISFGNKKSIEWLQCVMIFLVSQPAITCLKLTIETLEQRCEICSNLTPKRRHILHLSFSVSIINFEQVNTRWEVLICIFFILVYSAKK